MTSTERLSLLVEAGWFRDELDTSIYVTEPKDEELPVRAIDLIATRGAFDGPGVKISDACFITRYQPVTTRNFDEPKLVRWGQRLARCLRFGERVAARVLRVARRVKW